MPDLMRETNNQVLKNEPKANTTPPQPTTIKMFNIYRKTSPNLPIRIGMATASRKLLTLQHTEAAEVNATLLVFKIKAPAKPFSAKSTNLGFVCKMDFYRIDVT